LPQLWPPGAATNARNWVLENITSGNAHNGHVEIALDAPADLSDARVTRLSGTMDGDDLTVHWLRPIPPAEQGRAQLRFIDPDTLEVTVQSGHQRGSARTGGLTIRGGRIRISGLSRRDQVATIDGDVTGPLANVIAVLREPRLHLLDTHPIDLRDPSGDATVALTISLPLDENVRAEDVGIHAVAKLTDVHLRGFVAGRDIDHGMFDLDATADGLTVKGRTQVAGIAAQVDAAMDFRSGPPTQVQQRVTAVARPGAGQLAAAGLDAGDMLFGEVPLKAVWAERRNGDSDIAIEADLTPAVLAASPIGWRKPSGVAAKGSARVLLSHGRITGVDRIAIDGKGITVRGTAGWDAAGPRSVTLDRARLGRTDVRGTIRFPAGGPIGVTLAGPSLDATGKLETSAPKPRVSQETRQEPPDPAWTLDGRFDQVFLAHGQIARGVAASAANDGRVYRTLSVTGSTGANGHFVLSITPSGAGTIAPAGRDRKLSLTAADAGSLLRGLAIARTIEGGRLAVTGTFDDSDPAHPLSATAEIDDFRVRDAPALGKLLQAMTLYGLVDVLGGPGLGFTRLIAPLRMTDRLIQLNDARAFSSSLGLTAKGRIDLDQERADIQGTIVPAYFFNSLLGYIPLIGRLFSPEQGGGLFAARYSLVGPLEDPAVSVNPLSALTPGFLREVFGIF
jgi:hypothetical protein